MYTPLIDIRAIQTETQLERFIQESDCNVRVDLIRDDRTNELMLGFEMIEANEEPQGWDFWFQESVLGTVEFFKFVEVCFNYHILEENEVTFYASDY